MIRNWLASALVLLQALPAAAACSPDTAEFRWEGGQARFRVEIADTPEARRQGLMFRESLSSGAGMLFVFEQPHSASFWMKNTLIPLDMLFVEPDGRVGHVHENAVPGDLTAIPGGENIQFVVEINGGLARRLGLAEGAVLRHPAVNPELALWPCD